MLQMQRIMPSLAFPTYRSLATPKCLPQPAYLKSSSATVAPPPLSTSSKSLLALFAALSWPFSSCLKKTRKPVSVVPVDEPQTPPLRLVQPRHKIMSYNAEQFYKTGKGKFVKPMNSIQALAKAIQLEDPDVIALQEVGDKKVLEEFNTKFLHGKYPNIVSIPFDGAGQMRVGMMSKSNIKVVDSKSHWKEMSKDAAYHGKRDLLEATFETSSGYRFTVYDAHCKSMRGGEAETAPIRMKEVSNMANIVKAHLQNDPKAQIFVAGDFNTLPNTKYGKPVIETLTHVMGDKTQPDLVEVMMKDGKTDPTHSGHGHYPNSKLDYIFVTSPMAGQIKDAYVAGKFDQKPWNIASDHVPYVAVFEEPAKAAQTQKRQRVHDMKDDVQPMRKKQKLDLSA